MIVALPFGSYGESLAQAYRTAARVMAETGCSGVKLEGTVEPAARRVAEALDIPVIGIGASPACGGQILVTDDMLGLGAGPVPRFVKRYAQLGAEVGRVAAYAADVRARRFPAPEQCYGVVKTG